MPTVAARLSWQRELERLRSQVAAATVAAFDSERLIGQEAQAASRVRIGLLQRQLVIADAGARFTQADLDQVTAQIERQRQQFERELADQTDERRSGWSAARTRAVARTPGRPAQHPPELVTAREAQLEATDTATRVLRLMVEGANMERTMWELRFAAYDEA